MDNNIRLIKENETNCYGLLVEKDGYTSFELTKDKISNTLNESVLIGSDEGKYHPERGKDIYMLAILQKGGVRNKNGRIYPLPLLQREYKKYLNLIDMNRAMNEYLHPDSADINLERVSHVITKMWFEDNVLWGELKILTTDGFKERGIVSTVGDHAAHLLLNKLTLGISSRGVGSLKKVAGENVVQDDFDLICFDLVSSPSTPGAYLFTKKEQKDIYKENENKIITRSNDILLNSLKKFIGNEN